MESNNKWQLAATNGLLLSLVTIIYTLVQQVLTPGAFISILLWCIKFGGCLWLLYYFMKQYSANFEQITYGKSFGYGFLICCFSSIVCACFSFISLTLIFPDSIEMAREQMMTTIASQNMSSDQESMMEAIANNLPQITLFSSLVYCIIFGAIASSIIANFTKKTNIFAESANSAE